MAAKSRRIYITLNPSKEKDRVIENYLSQSYSEKDAIKEAIYRLATNSINMIQNISNNTEMAQIVEKEYKPNSDNKVRNGANSIEMDKNITNSDKVLNDTNNTETVHNELEQNEMDELSKFL